MKNLSKILFVAFLTPCLVPHGGVTQQIEFNIQKTSLESLLDIQVSSAAKYAQSISRAPASVTLITSDDIEQYGYQTLADVMRSIRGFYLSYDRNYKYVGIRGFSRPTDYNNRILLLINGHSFNENIFGSMSPGTEFALDLDVIERIEIIRGPGSALYGTSAMFAVVNVITKKGDSIDGLKLSAQTGSFGRLQGSAVLGKEFASGIEVTVSGRWTDIDGQDLYYEEFDDPSTNNGISKGLDWDKYCGLLTTIAYEDLTLQGYISSRKKGIPTGPWEANFNDPATETLDEHSFFELKYKKQISTAKHIMLRGYLDHYSSEGSYPYDLIWKETIDGDWLGGEFQFLWDLRVNNRLTVGAEYQKHLRAEYIAWDAETSYFAGDFPFHVLSFYLQDEYQATENLSFTLGIRRDEYSTVESATTPRGAIILKPTESATLKLLYGEAFRAPNVYEVNYDDEEDNKSNLALKPEKIKTTELIWEHRFFRELSGIVSIYHYKIEGLIDQALDPADDLYQFHNLYNVEARGLEFGLNVRMERGRGGYVNYAFQNTEDEDSKKLTNSPSHIAKMGLFCPLIGPLNVAPEVLYETERRTVYDIKTDAYLLTKLRFSTQSHPRSGTLWSSLFRRVQLSLLIDNLFNVAYETPGGFEHLQPAISQDGRNYLLKLDCRF
jgi:outer membrane receptor for ferrienterochelin and colicins